MNKTELINRKNELLNKIDSVQTEAELRDIELDLDKVTSLLKYSENEKRSSSESDPDVSNISQAAEFLDKNLNNVEKKSNDLLSSKEYRKAFMDFVQKGVASDILKRADEFSETGDIGKLIPNTISSEIIKSIRYNTVLFPRVRKLNVAGGVEFPISTMRPTARWIGETDSSESAKTEVKDSISFKYYMLECEMAQTLLSKIVSLDVFENLVIDHITEAMYKQLDFGILKGSGSGQMLGVCNESRIKSTQIKKIKDSDLSNWAYFVKLVSAIPIEYRSSSVLIMAQGTWDIIATLQDNTGQPIARVNYGINGAEMLRFAGREVLLVSDELLPDVSTAKQDDVVIVGIDLNDYAINTNYNMAFDVYEEKRKHMIYTRALMIADGKLLDSQGVLLVKKGA